MFGTFKSSTSESKSNLNRSIRVAQSIEWWVDPNTNLSILIDSYI